MPSAAPRPCAHPACTELVPNGRCTAHARQQDRDRGTAQERGYGARWQRARASYLSHHPMCAHCLQTGRTTLAVVVDHVLPHRGDHDLFWASGNWQSLCITCHNRKTARGE